MPENEIYALVTGASSGIGFHITCELAERGYSILAVSDQPAELDILKEKIQGEYAVTVVCMNIDLSQEDSALQVFTLCEEKGIEVEVLVNNAGMLVFGRSFSAGYSRSKTIMNLHMNTPALLSILFGDKMMARRKGYILNVSSISSVMPYPGISLYGPTKSFMRNYTRALRTEVKPFGIQVTCLIPGATVTNLYDVEGYNLSLLLKLGVFKMPETVAKAAVKALWKRRPECIPGWLNKIIVLLFPLIPHSLIGLIYRKTDLIP